MPLENPDALLDMLDEQERITRDAAHRIADAGVDRLEANVKRNTPVDTNPYRHDPERPRGTLRESFHRRPGLEIVVRGDRETYEGAVESEDEIAGWIEEGTLAHIIRAKVGRFLHFQSRDGFVGKDGIFHPPGTWVTVSKVEHPAVAGAHMCSIGALTTELEIDDWSRDELERWKGEIEAVHT